MAKNVLIQRITHPTVLQVTDSGRINSSSATSIVPIITVPVNTQ